MTAPTPAAASCVIDVNNGTRRFSGKPDQTLFAAFRSHGILLPTGCGARGICGQCKVKVTAGQAGLLTDAEAKLIPEADRAAGCRLACQARLSGDLAVQVPDYVFGAGEHGATLRESIPLTHDITRFSFELADGDEIPHRAGQFMTLAAKVPGEAGLVMRCFSFATPPEVRDRVDIIVRKNPRGVMSPYLLDRAAPGDAFKIIAPYGDFYLREGASPCVWIAGGSGLSPFIAMVQDMVARKVERPVHLFFGAVLPQDLYYADVLQGMAEMHGWFRFTPALSGPERSECCRDYGLITDVVARHVGDASESEGYLCGSPGMIAACLNVLTEKGMRRDRVYYDRF